MYWLVENDEQLNVLINSGFDEAFIEVIPSNNTIHPSLNHVSLLYIRPINASKGFMLCIDHSEALNSITTDYNDLLKKFKVLYCRDKKELLHYLPLKTLYDINIPPTTYIQPTTPTHELYYRNHSDNPQLNKIIPIVKHYEVCEQIFEDLKNNINTKKTKYDEFFNSRVCLVFNAIERSGIRVHVPRFKEYFHPIDGERVYTQYNLKTLTTRPSNKFKGVNYAALNKENGCRKCFIPHNDSLIEIDISAYHPSLSCSLIGYNFPTVDIHEHFKTLYKVDYKKSKELTFKQLYGGVFKQYEHLEYFKKIKEYVGKIWKEFESVGFIECPVSGFIYRKDKLNNMNPQKLFNYVLQNLETSTNVLILWDIFCLLKGKKTKLVLYTYDSFLFDFAEDEGYILEEIKDIFKKKKLNIKQTEGYDYNFAG